MALTLLGVHEVADLAHVSTSAVANWRKRFADFPKPLAELKAGPVYDEEQIRQWLAKRNSDDVSDVTNSMYERLADFRDDPPELREKVNEVVVKLQREATSTQRPGILLGRVQSGKTKAFLGAIAKAFDAGYGAAIILTKGTKSLTEQTLSRVRHDFREFIASDEVNVFNILKVPDLTRHELARKLIFVVKKEDDNLRRLIKLVEDRFPQLREQQVLIVDDEADLASVTSRRVGGNVTQGVISGQIDQFRELVPNSAFLQVTATPYALYLQPAEEVATMTGSFFKPKRPAFTVILPLHDKYIGGDEYFEYCNDPDHAAYFFYREVPHSERDAMKKEDRRRLQIDNVLMEKNARVITEAIVTFLVGGTIRTLHQADTNQPVQKYSFLFHTEQSKQSHDWQVRIAKAIRDALVDQARGNTPHFIELVRTAYDDLKRSIAIIGKPMPTIERVHSGVRQSLLADEMMITKVNSDNDIEELLADDGQLKLRVPFNIFIGGQILDRGITINNLIGFYYGRNPNRSQQDTVLQHCRMYGARHVEDVAVTRFYAPPSVYQIMHRIHEFDASLRNALESGDHERGVYFIQRDPSNRLIPCAPSKIQFSNIVSVRPNRRLVLSGFQTVPKTQGHRTLKILDDLIKSAVGKDNKPILIPVEIATRILDTAYSLLDMEQASNDDKIAHQMILRHLSTSCTNTDLKNQVYAMVTTDHSVSRLRKDGRYSDSPENLDRRKLAKSKAQDIPVVMLLRQNGDEALGWRGLPFWWPVIFTPALAPTTVFATEQPVSVTSMRTNNLDRPLSSDVSADGV